ncbi:hypothetical protein E1B28_004410 [Marasmius oreades]|uniref:D-lactate dehydratase n=1 Tax=Marasmius oreades TaxID=181124 RepID=A0A9P8ACX7_9AGAR|nr:uncharacterized protein E1B28_004410 [Marasmius oreades]KAG7097017.1 hypothetical protein E1B28_004410 [Marasmius oreades]
MPSILFIFTSADKTLKGDQTGYYLPEAAHPYYILAPHFNIDFASPKGANPPVDEGSVKMFAQDKECIQWLKDDTVKSKLANAKKLSEVNASDYDAVFYPGGHGPVIDLPFDIVNHKLASEFYQSGKITSAVCHGPAALVGATGKDGKSVFHARKATGFSNVEEEQVQKVESVPFLLEDKIKQNGGSYEKADEPWGAKIVVDGNLITGQNPNSAKGVGEAILSAFKK